MKVTAITAALLLAATPSFGQSTRPTTEPATTRPAVEVRVLGVEIQRDIPAALENNTLVRSFTNGRSSSQGPVQILLAVTPTDGRVVEADPGQLNVTTFVDDTYQDLRLMDPRRNSYSGNNGANLAADGSAAVYWIQSERAPAEKAERMLLRGDLLLKTTSAEKKTERLPLALRVGETLKVADAELSVASVSLSYASGRAGEPQTVRGVQVQLRSDDDLDFIRDTTFFDAKGERLDVNASNRGGSRREGQPSTLSFYLPRLEEGVAVQFTYADAVRERRVPFEVQIDLGAVRLGEPPKAEDEKPKDAAGADARDARPVEADPSFGVPRARVDWPATPARAVAFPDRAPATWAAVAEVVEPGQTPAVRPGFAARAPFPTTRPQEAALPTLEGAKVRAVALGVGTVPPDAAGEWPVNPAVLFQPFGGTQVQLLASVPGRRIAGIETKLLKIDAFTDDTGATLATTLVPTAGAAEDLKHTADPHYEVGGGADAAVREDGGAALLAFALAAAPDGRGQAVPRPRPRAGGRGGLDANAAGRVQAVAGRHLAGPARGRLHGDGYEHPRRQLLRPGGRVHRAGEVRVVQHVRPPRVEGPRPAAAGRAARARRPGRPPADHGRPTARLPRRRARRQLPPDVLAAQRHADGDGRMGPARRTDDRRFAVRRDAGRGTLRQPMLVARRDAFRVEPRHEVRVAKPERALRAAAKRGETRDKARIFREIAFAVCFRAARFG